MKATLIETKRTTSKYGGSFYFAFFKGEDGKSYRSCLYPRMANFKRWEPFLYRKRIILDGLKTKGKLIDADSYPVFVKYDTTPHPDEEKKVTLPGESQD